MGEYVRQVYARVAARRGEGRKEEEEEEEEEEGDAGLIYPKILRM